MANLPFYLIMENFVRKENFTLDFTGVIDFLLTMFQDNKDQYLKISDLLSTGDVQIKISKGNEQLAVLIKPKTDMPYYVKKFRQTVTETEIRDTVLVILSQRDDK